MNAARVLIQDSISNEYYAVPNYNVESEENGFPYWTNDIEDAADFKSELFAKHEMNMLDLTDCGTRNPIIITN